MSVKINAKMVGELRESTGAGLMDCKNALVESEGDFDAAVEILRKKGMATAAKRLVARLAMVSSTLTSI